jgi:magnesium transporter
MQIIYQKKVSSVKDKSLEIIKNYSKGAWIMVTNPTPEELTLLAEKFSIEKEILTDMVDDDSVPVVEKEQEEGYIYSILRIPHKYSSNEVVTIPLGILFLSESQTVITVCKESCVPLTKLIAKTPSRFRTDKKSIFFSTLIRFVLNSYMSELNRIEAEIKDAENSIRMSLENKEIVKLLSYQKTLVYFKTSMVGNRKVVSKVGLGRIFSINEENKELLEDSLIDIDEAQQLVTIYDEIIKNTIDAYSSIVSNNLNVIMKFLALITIALSIPTMVASFYGMNVPIPMQNSQEMFFFALGISVILSVFAIAYFKYKKWM